MFFKFIKESFRNKQNRPLSFFVNWLGMTLGFAAVIVMYLYIIGEVRHDKNVYTRPMTDVYRCEVEKDMGAICPAALAEFLADMPEVKASTKAMVAGGQTVSTMGLATNNKFKLPILLGDSSLLNVLPFKFVAGNPKDALSDDGKALVSRQTALQLYGTIDVVGKAIEVNNEHSLQIVGVIEDAPENSTFQPKIIGNIKFLAKLYGRKSAEGMFSMWGSWNYETHLRLHPGVDLMAFEAKYSKATKDKISQSWGSEFKDTPALRAFGDIYLSGDIGYTHAKSTDPNSLKILAIIAVLILVIAIINYVNIYTARSTEVIRAMGIKTIMGAQRGQLIGFVIGDSIVITLLSTISAYIVAASLEPVYPSIIGSSVSFAMTWDTLLILFIGLPVVCGVLSGIFPSLALTRMKPLDAIANRSSGGRQMAIVRNVLIIFQFTITIGLIASTLFINKQMNHMANMKLGYNRNQVYVINGSRFISPKFETFRSTLLSNASILNASLMKNSPVSVGEFQTSSWGETDEESLTTKIQWADENALALIGVAVVEGDSISPTNVRNLTYDQIMINEAFAKKLREQIPGITFPYKNIIGVFKDFQHQSLTETITPLAWGSIWKQGRVPFGDAYIRIQGGDIPKTLSFIEKTFAQYYPDEIYEGYFLDEAFSSMYKDSQLFQARLLTFSILAIFIGCLGLFALVGYSVERRRKEIAIRKVYGSTIGQVLWLLSTSFLRWLGVSFIIAVPIVWWVMTHWVEQFAYRTTLSWWIFAVAGLAALTVALITVLGQTYKAATENPARSIKGE